MVDALLNIFPEIGLVKKEFQSRPSKPITLQHISIHVFVLTFSLASLGNYWSEESNRKNLFLAFAREQKFDPLIAQNWYSASRQAFTRFKVSASSPPSALAVHLLDLKGSCTVLLYYKGSFGKALLQLFPNIGLDKDTFQPATSMY